MALILRRAVQQLQRLMLPLSVRSFHDEFTKKPPPDDDGKRKLEVNVSPAARSIAAKYQIFRDADAPVILDVDEERILHDAGGTEYGQDDDQTSTDAYRGINLERGKTGVYDIEDLVQVLQLNNAADIFVCTVPADIKYVDYICIVTGLSTRHMRGIAEFVRRVYKKKKRQTGDIIPRIEGENSNDWVAMDLGNIALHIFSAKARNVYDLESLWSVGPEYDREYNKPSDRLVELYEKHSIYLHDLKPRQKPEDEAMA